MTLKIEIIEVGSRQAVMFHCPLLNTVFISKNFLGWKCFLMWFGIDFVLFWDILSGTSLLSASFEMEILNI